MCGISGIVTYNKNFNHTKLSSDLKGMVDVISHRGPDGEGTWIKKKCFFCSQKIINY